MLTEVPIRLPTEAAIKFEWTNFRDSWELTVLAAKKLEHLTGDKCRVERHGSGHRIIRTDASGKETRCEL